MPNPQIEQFTQTLFWKAVPWIVLCSVIGTFGRLAMKWLERKAKSVGRSREHKRDARSEENRQSQTAATGPRRIFTPSSCPPAARSPAQRQAPPPVPALTLEDITWENFELLAGEIFRRKGFEVEISSGLGADGGKDLTLRKDGEVRLVQCKFLSAENKVSVKAIREFFGLLVAEKAKSGIFMTTGLYSRDAREFAEGTSIELLGRAEIEQLMASVARSGENLCNIRTWINDFVAVAHVTDPNCPRCRNPMKLRPGARGLAFWGCSLYGKTRCRGKRSARTELVQAFSYQGAKS